MPFNGPVELNVVPWVAGDLGTTLGTATGAALAFQQEGWDRRLRVHLRRRHGQSWRRARSAEPGGVLAAADRVRVPEQRLGDLASGSSYLAGSVAARAAGYGIPGACVDGNDVEAVRAASAEAVARARAARGRA